MSNLFKIECCREETIGRVYNIGPNSFLVYTDECTCCGQPVAEVRHKTPAGEFITSVRRKGPAADRLLEKYGFQYQEFNYKTYSGTRAKEYSFTNRYGIIYNDNGVRIAPQDEFLKMTRQEVNIVLNKRFYTVDKIKV